MTATQMAPPPTLAAALATLPDDADRALQEISERISKEFYRLLPAEDLAQEFLLWLAEHPGHARQWHFVGEDDVERFGWKSFRRDAARVMAGAARREKARVFGYDPEDEVFYAKQQVQDLLKFVWESSVGAVDGPAQGERVTTKNDPAKGGDKAAAIMDVRNAYQAVIFDGGQWAQILEAIYRHGATQRECAAALEIAQQTVSKHHDRALSAILTALNGTLPLRENGGPGARTAITNRVAIAALHREEG